MPRKSGEILAQALKLSPIDRAELVEKILASFEFSDRDRIDSLWAVEVEDRIAAYERGEISSLSAREVFDRIQKVKPE